MTTPSPEPTAGAMRAARAYFHGIDGCQTAIVPMARLIDHETGLPELIAERDRLAATVAKLPKTADGAPISIGDYIFYDDSDSSLTYRLGTERVVEQHVISMHVFGDRLTDRVGLLQPGSSVATVGHARNCYGTREVALAAAADPGRQTTGGEAAPSPSPAPERMLADYVGTYRIGPNAPETWADDHLIGVESDGSTWMKQDGSEKREGFWSWNAVAGMASRGELRKL